MVDRVERMTRLEMPFKNRVLRIVISGHHESGSEDIALSQQLVDHKLVQQLIIRDYDNVDLEEAETAICGLLLNGYVIYRQAENVSRYSGRGMVGVSGLGSAGSQLGVAPAWLTRGVARNLYPSLKARNASQVLARWEQGLAPSVKQFLEPADEAERARARGKFVCGLFLAWLLSLPDRGVLFDAIFDEVAQGRSLSATRLAGSIGECDSTGELEKMWDDWILRQKRVIYEPGILTTGLLRRFRSELVVFSGEYGAVSGGNDGPAMQLEDLISRRNESWVSAWARNKSARLRILFVGRGEELEEVAEDYCRFLDGLARRGSGQRLRGLLHKAHGKLEVLDDKYAER